jgi:hypothetical protein
VSGQLNALAALSPGNEPPGASMGAMQIKIVERVRTVVIIIDFWD